MGEMLHRLAALHYGREAAQANPDRFTGPALYATTGTDADTDTLIERTRPTGDDLADELTPDVCAALICILDAGQYEIAGRCLGAVRDALHRRFMAHSYGSAPAVTDEAMAALTAQVIRSTVAA